MMDIDLNKKPLAALLLAFMALAIVPACSSSDEASQEEGATGDTGVPCELDIMQEGCSREDVDM